MTMRSWLTRILLVVGIRVVAVSSCGTHSEQFPKLLKRKAGVLHDSAHHERIYRVVSRHGNEPKAVGHYDMSSLSNNPESPLFKYPDRVKVVDARKTRHRLNHHFHFTYRLTFQGVSNCGQVFPDGVLDVFQRLLLGRALRPASGQARARHAESLFRFPQYHFVNHHSPLILTFSSERRGI